MKWLFVGLTLILLFWLHITSSDKSVCCGLTRNWAPNIPFVWMRRRCLFNKSHRFWWNMRDWVIFGNLVWFIISYWQLLDRWWRKKKHTQSPMPHFIIHDVYLGPEKLLLSSRDVVIMLSLQRNSKTHKSFCLYFLNSIVTYYCIFVSPLIKQGDRPETKRKGHSPVNI